MEKRDLKADLDWMMKSPSDHAKELEIAVHALERAIEAEALARELVAALDIAVKEMLYAGAFCVVVDRRITRVMIKVLTKAKEVLGDGEVR